MINKLNVFLDAIHGAASQALVCDDFAWSERYQHISSVSSVRRRLAHQAIHKAVRICPDYIRGCLTQKYERAGLEVLGIGRSSTVIRMGDSAIKIMRSTADTSAADRQKTIETLEFRQKILLNYMSAHALEQTFTVIDHPITTKKVVVAIQPIVEGFSPIEINNTDSLLTLSEDQKISINRFTSDALEMATETGWAPDVLGASNFGFTGNTDKLVLVDTLPLCTDGAHSSAVKYLTRMSIASSA